MRTFLEGIDAVRLPCTLAVLVPAIIVIVAAGRRSPVAYAGFVLGATTIAWARFSDNWIADPNTIASIGLGLVFAGAVVTAWRWGHPRPEVVGPAALVAGGITTWLWQPCVGQRLGDILNNAANDPAAEILPMLAYVLGTTLIAFGLVVLPTAWPRLVDARDHRWVRGSAVGGGLLIGATIAVGAYDDLVAELLRRSSI